MTDSNITRRAMIGAISAAPIAGLLTAVPAVAATPADTTAWDAALAAFREAEAVHHRLWQRFDQATEAMEAALPPREAWYFDDAKLGMFMGRDDIEYWLRCYVARTGQPLDIARTADEFAAYQRRHAEVRDEYKTERCFEEANAQLPSYLAARDALMAVPAPHVAALLVKIEIATTSLDDDHAESMLADARRLLDPAGRA